MSVCCVLAFAPVLLLEARNFLDCSARKQKHVSNNVQQHSLLTITTVAVSWALASAAHAKRPSNTMATAWRAMLALFFTVLKI
jgi:hypothetical protein